jgi:hypothetical protein
MATRTLYTKSEVTLDSTVHVENNEVLVNGVTSATYTKDTPREQVTVFGKQGQIATVQNESTSATIEFVFHPYEGTTGLEGPDPENDTSYFKPLHMNNLMNDAAEDTPTGQAISVGGVGRLTSAILTSITAEGSVGALPTITCSFDGTYVSDAPPKVTTSDTQSFTVANMADVSVTDGATSAYAQSATFNWEMPIEKLNKLGNSVDSATTYGTPPGTASISVEATDSVVKTVGVKFGDWNFNLDDDSDISNQTNNLAVGEIGATYNTTTEGVADGCTCS